MVAFFATFSAVKALSAIPSLSIGVDPDYPQGASEWGTYYETDHSWAIDGGVVARFKVTRPPWSAGVLTAHFFVTGSATPTHLYTCPCGDFKLTYSFDSYNFYDVTYPNGDSYHFNYNFPTDGSNLWFAVVTPYQADFVSESTESVLMGLVASPDKAYTIANSYATIGITNSQFIGYEINNGIGGHDTPLHVTPTLGATNNIVISRAGNVDTNVPLLCYIYFSENTNLTAGTSYKLVTNNTEVTIFTGPCYTYIGEAVVVIPAGVGSVTANLIAPPDGGGTPARYDTFYMYPQPCPFEPYYNTKVASSEYFKVVIKHAGSRPAQPEGLTFESPTGSTNVISWQNNSPDSGDTITIEYQTNGGAWVVIGTLPGDANSFNHTNVAINATNSYRIKICNGTNCTDYIYVRNELQLVNAVLGVNSFTFDIVGDLNNSSCLIESSTNLTIWQTESSLTVFPLNKRLIFTDASLNGVRHKIYRARCGPSRSTNALGFVIADAPAGGSYRCNPLVATDNRLSSLFPSPPQYTSIYLYRGSSSQYTYDTDLGGWDADDSIVLLPGEGFYISNPTTNAFQISFVGDVKQGAITNVCPQFWSYLASPIPQKGLLSTDLGFPLLQLDSVYRIRGGATYQNTYDSDVGGWDPTQPDLEIGEGFWNYAPSATSWVRNVNIWQ